MKASLPLTDLPVDSRWIDLQYRLGQRAGHYESYFLRANHPDKPQALWIRYTLFQAAGHPESAIGELWAIWSDADRQEVIALQQDIPLEQCDLAPRRLRLGEAFLQPQQARGMLQQGTEQLGWNLQFGDGQVPLLCLPAALYHSPLPKAKLMVAQPNARFTGELSIKGETRRIERWQGSVNHNWGRKHTDAYAWGQVAGFDNAPESFFEIATARLQLGSLWTPPLTLAVLRHQGQEYRFNQLHRLVQAKGDYRFFEWRFELRNSHYQLQGQISAPRETFAGLPYKNPPGGIKTCLNSKLAQCELQLTRRSATPVRLTTLHRAAFEILTDASDHGIAVLGGMP